MTEREALCIARKLISNRLHWCKHDFHTTNMFGMHQYCAVGALRQVGGGDYGRHFLEQAAYQMYGKPVLSVNDELGHRAMLKVYDHAIELACAREEKQNESQ